MLTIYLLHACYIYYNVCVYVCVYIYIYIYVHIVLGEVLIGDLGLSTTLKQSYAASIAGTLARPGVGPEQFSGSANKSSYNTKQPDIPLSGK